MKTPDDTVPLQFSKLTQNLSPYYLVFTQWAYFFPNLSPSCVDTGAGQSPHLTLQVATHSLWGSHPARHCGWAGPGPGLHGRHGVGMNLRVRGSQPSSVRPTGPEGSTFRFSEMPGSPGWNVSVRFPQLHTKRDSETRWYRRTLNSITWEACGRPLSMHIHST